MTIQDIANKLSSRPKGSIFSLVTRRAIKSKKGFAGQYEKQSQIQGLVKIEYANTKNVKAGILEKERDTPHLPRGVKRAFYVGELKFFEMVNGNICLAVNISGNQPRSIFFKNGKQVAKEEIQDEVLAADLQEKKTRAELEDQHASPFVMVGLDNIQEIH